MMRVCIVCMCVRVRVRAAASSFFFLADAIAYLITNHGTLAGDNDNPYGADAEAQPAQRHERWRSALGTAHRKPFVHSTAH